MRRLTSKEASEALQWFQQEIDKRYISKGAGLASIAGELNLNYSQLVNIMGGRVKPPIKLLEKLGYKFPEWTSPTGNKWTQGLIIEVELSPETKHKWEKFKLGNSVRSKPYDLSDTVMAKVWQELMAKAVEYVLNHADELLTTREPTEREKELNAARQKDAAKPLTERLAAVGHFSDRDEAALDEIDVMS